MPIILFLFFLSGAIGLIDEIIWTRMLLLIFGSTTYSIVAVLSTFMAGLALGSYFLGKLADRQKNLLAFYGILEIGVGMFTLLTIYLIPTIREIYKFIYQQSSNQQLISILKFFLSAATLLPATFFMGGTLPALIRFFTKKQHELGKQTGLLYAVNTFGAALGTLIAGFVFIEVFGLKTTLMIASVGNLAIGSIVLFFQHSLDKAIVYRNKTVLTIKSRTNYSSTKITIATIIFGFSGLLSMAYEVAWTRLLTPSVGTYIYAFSIILSLFLVGIAIGSFLIRKILPKYHILFVIFGLVEVGIGFFAISSLVVTSQLVDIITVIKVPLVILPATILMGMTFPILTTMFLNEEKIGSTIGITYTANTIGSILGPIIAGYILMPLFGTTKTILMLASFNLLLGIILIQQESDSIFPKRIINTCLTLIMFIIFLLSLSKSELFLEKSISNKIQQLKQKNYSYLFIEDEAAATLAYRNKQKNEGELLVDGVSMTGLSDETKFMAHLPLFLHPKPEKMLVIAFGMGTSFRSALTHNIKVDGVELIPSVPKAFSIFHNDAQSILSNPKAKIIIEDGRNYVFLTKEKYDVITVDPPPPLNSANTTLLYAKEFYEQAKQILTENGIFTQWIFLNQARSDDIAMLVKSFTDVFPYVSIWRGPGGWGMYLLGSKQKIVIDKNIFVTRYQEEKVFKDLNEWRTIPYTLKQIFDLFLGNKDLTNTFTAITQPVTDDHPNTEYFLLRHKLIPKPRFIFN